jgi:hypothetical protein
MKPPGQYRTWTAWAVDELIRRKLITTQQADAILSEGVYTREMVPEKRQVFTRDRQSSPEKRVPPPPGFSSWLRYAVATFDTRTPFNEQSMNDYSYWGRPVDRQEMRDAAHHELEELLEQLACHKSLRHRFASELADALAIINSLMVKIKRSE